MKEGWWRRKKRLGRRHEGKEMTEEGEGVREVRKWRSDEGG